MLFQTLPNAIFIIVTIIIIVIHVFQEVLFGCACFVVDSVTYSPLFAVKYLHLNLITVDTS